MKLSATPIALALVGLCGFAPASALAGDQENIQGSWILESASVDGRAIPNASGTYIFTGETLVLRLKAGTEQKATFTLETASEPKVLVIQRDRVNAKPDRSPYELDGDTLRIIFPTPDEHPKEISDAGHVLFTLKRKKP